MGSGRYAEAATYGPGQKVVGVVVGGGEVRVHVVVSWPLPEPIPALAERVRERVALRSGNRAATVVVEDLEVVGGTTGAPTASSGGDVDVDL